LIVLVSQALTWHQQASTGLDVETSFSSDNADVRSIEIEFVLNNFLGFIVVEVSASYGLENN
jgi:hypothetical protein